MPKIVTEEERLSTSRRIIRAAAEEFAMVGFEQAKMETISERASIGKGTIYLYFESKRGLFSAVLAEISAEQLAALRQALAEVVAPPVAPDLRQMLTTLLGTFNTLAIEQPDGFRIFISSLFGVNRQFKSEAAALRRIFLDLIKDELEEYKTKGEITLPYLEPAALLILNTCELWALRAESLGFDNDYVLSHQAEIVTLLLAGLKTA